MIAKLGELKAEARSLALAGNYAEALRAYDRILAAIPHDYEIRFRIADILAAAGWPGDAALVYQALAMHNIRAGHPLPTLVAAHILLSFGRNADDIFNLLGNTYGSGSPHLARYAVRQAPLDPETPVPGRPTTDNAPLERLAARACARALDLSAAGAPQQQFHPLPFLSEFGPAPLVALLRSVTVKRVKPGETVVRQGETGDSLYLVAAGELVVHVCTPDGGEKEIARLYENTLFGEMAILTRQPRHASVTAAGEADLIEISRRTLDHAISQNPLIREALDRFARQRLIKNLLSSSPLFVPFTKEQQADLLGRFEGADVEAGTAIIRQGQPGEGLFVVVSGSVDVIVRGSDGVDTTVAQLGAGDIFGEMSLLTEQPTSATVRAKEQSTVLFLAKTFVERLAAAVPEIQSYFEEVAMKRLKDNSLRRTADAFDIPIDLDLDDTDIVAV